jgi:hypothetical protein
MIPTLIVAASTVAIVAIAAVVIVALLVVMYIMPRGGEANRLGSGYRSAPPRREWRFDWRNALTVRQLK